MAEPDKNTALNMYKQMLIIRHFEEEIQKAYWEGKSTEKIPYIISEGPVPGEMHLSMGQEPTAVGVATHLKKEDVLVSTHRAHHTAIAKGVDIKKMTAEIFGKKTGLGGGKGGHMHLFDPSVRFSCGGIEGGSWPQATGAALAFKMRKEPHVAVAFGGEGAANQGTFHESLNLASLWKLPVVFVVEDNDWAISVHRTKSTSVERNSDRAVAYGIPGVHVSDNDLFAIYEEAGKAIERARNGDGPTLLDIETYRFAAHFEGDPEVYRTKKEVASLKEKDTIKRVRKTLMDKGWLNDKEDENFRNEAEKIVSDAIKFARESPYPEPNETLQGVFGR